MCQASRPADRVGCEGPGEIVIECDVAGSHRFEMRSLELAVDDASSLCFDVPGKVDQSQLGCAWHKGKHTVTDEGTAADESI